MVVHGFFFSSRRRHTRFDCDWSSDVCSSDLVLAGAEQAMAVAGDPVERLQGFIRHHVTFFAANLAEMKVLSHEANSLTGERHRKVNAIKRRYVDMLDRLLKDGAPEEPPAEPRD